MSLRVDGHRQTAAALGRWENRFRRNLLLMTGAFSARLEARAVEDRPWTDQTNAARNSITATFDEDGRDIVVALAIGVEYGKHLELARGGRYRVVRPTVDAMRDEFVGLPKDAFEVTRL